MERKKYERDVIDKCIDESKLFNGKMKHREGITKLKVKEAVYEQAQEKVFKGISMNAVSVTNEEILKMLKELDVNKSMGPNGVSNWILKESSEQLAGKIPSVVVT